MPSRTQKPSKSHPKPSFHPSSTSQPPPPWPLLHPLVPAADLHLETLLDDQIILIRNLFTSTLCKKLVPFLASLPLVTTAGQLKRGEALRVNDRFEVNDWGFAERLWRQTALRELVLGCGMGGDNEVEQGMGEEERKGLWGGEVLGLNPRIRVYRYGKDQFFDQHCRLSHLRFFHFVHHKDSNHPLLPNSSPIVFFLYLSHAQLPCEFSRCVAPHSSPVLMSIRF